MICFSLPSWLQLSQVRFLLPCRASQALGAGWAKSFTRRRQPFLPDPGPPSKLQHSTAPTLLPPGCPGPVLVRGWRTQCVTTWEKMSRPISHPHHCSASSVGAQASIYSPPLCPKPFHFRVFLRRGQRLNLKEPSGLTCGIRIRFLPSHTASQHSRLVSVEWVWRGRFIASAIWKCESLECGTVSSSSLSSFYPRCTKHPASS